MAAEMAHSNAIQRRQCKRFEITMLRASGHKQECPRKSTSWRLLAPGRDAGIFDIARPVTHVARKMRTKGSHVPAKLVNIAKSRTQHEAGDNCHVKDGDSRR
jgi:hypothetical protein